MGGWINNNIGANCDITTGKKDANIAKEFGKYDFYTSGIEKYKTNSFEFEGQSITVAGNGATVGYMHLADGKFDAYQRTYVLSNFNTNRFFTFYSMQNELPKVIGNEARAGNIPYIVLSMLEDLKLTLPNIKEQTKIGELFKNLDDLITLTKKKYEKLKNIKNGLLAKMFC